MKLVKRNVSILQEISQSFDFKHPPFDPVEFSQELIKEVYTLNGLSLAAIQVGIPLRIFAMRGAPENFVVFNPKIVMLGKETIRLEETCLTYPGLSVKVKRPQHCRVRFATPNGEIRTETFTGITARVFQQNLDLLDGIPFYKNANPIHREQAFRKWKNIDYGQKK